MLSTRSRNRVTSVVGAVGLALLATAGVAGTAMAAEEGGGNNLSVPAIFVPSVGLAGPVCTDGVDAKAVTGELGILVDGVLEHPGYYVQGDDIWQAECDVAADDTVSATAEWGDNLTNAPLKQRTPVRVEIGLIGSSATPMGGYLVEKLDPELDDRYSHYGTQASEPQPLSEVRVWNAGTTLKIYRDSDDLKVYDGPFTAEINSTGRVVYGYNWQKPLAGTYTLTVSTPTVLLVGKDAGELVDSDADGDFDTVTLSVEVAVKAGGGKGGGKPVR